MKRNFKLLVAVLVLVVMVFTLASCEMIQGIIDKIVPGEHEHEYSADWSSDETNHWHAAICEDGEECASATADLAAHTFAEGACSVCGYADPNYVPECTEHTPGTPEVIKAATCTEAGEEKLTCTVCGESWTQEIAATGHTEVTVEGSAPTCTAAGLSSGKQCSVCGETLKAQTEIGATGHKFADGVCSVCGEADPDYSVDTTKGSINVATTDTYCNYCEENDFYTFTAEAAGTYTFTVPAGLGVYSKASYDTWGNPEVDFQLSPNGGEFSVTLAEGEAYSFHVNAATMADWVINWTWSETTQGGGNSGDDPVVGEETALTIGYNNIDAANVTYAYTATDDGTLLLSAGGAIQGDVAYYYSVNGDDFITLPLYEYVELALVAGDKVVVVVEATGYSNLYTEWAGQSAGAETVDLTIGNNAIDGADVIYSYVASENGTLTLSAGGAVEGMVEFSYVVGDGESTVLELNTSVELALVAGDKVVITVAAEGYSTLTAAWDNGQGGDIAEPDGSEDNPYVWDTIPESVVLDYDKITGKVYYIFTATADGSIVFTWPVEADSWFDFYELDADGNNTSNTDSGYMKNSHSFVVEAGKTYRVSLGSWSEAGSHTITVAYASCEHEWSEATCNVLSTCSKCGATTGDYADHIPNSANPTCGDPAECTVCGTETGYIPHTFDDGVITTPADCATGTNGVKVFTCSVCGGTEEETIYAYHTWDYSGTVENTCTTDGVYHAVCTVCEYVDTYETYATGHWSYAYLACGESGVCNGCGETYTKEHSMFPANCTQAAFCTNCNYVVGEALGHTAGAAATCTAAQLCTVCFEVLEAAKGHADENGDFKCDACSTQMLPEADSILTLEQAIAIGNLYTKDNYTTNKYYVTATIKSVYNTQYGNMTLVDANGNEFTVYGSYSADGSDSYSDMESKPIDGDTVTVYGIIGYYNAPQMKNVWITEFEHVHAYSEATCTVAPTCVCGLTSGEALGHSYEGGICVRCSTADPDYEGEIEAGKALAFEINSTQFDSSSYANNNTTKTVNDYSYTSYQVYKKSGADEMQWQKNKAYITVDETNASGIVKIELAATAGTYTVTVGGTTVTGTTVDGVTTYDLTGLSGEIKIAESGVTGYTSYVKFYK